MTSTLVSQTDHRMVGALLSIVFVLAPPSWAAEYYASPDARPRARGSREDPFDLASALAATGTFRPGDTLWLLGGTYQGAFESKLQGSRDNPITIRQAPGERSTIDCRTVAGGNSHFNVGGDWVVFRDFEITCSLPQRSTKLSGSGPADLNRGGVHCRAGQVKFINLVVHDTATAFGFWSDGEGGEIYGCLIYNNGWRGPNRSHGHGIYSQNLRGVKRLVDNVIFNQFAYGIHCYGSSKAFLQNYHIEGNFSFNNGSLRGPGSRAPNIFVGGSCPVSGVSILNNLVYSDLGTTGIRLGYPWGPSNTSAVVKNNYVVGDIHIKEFDALTCTGNTLIGNDTLVTLEIGSNQKPSRYRWDNNAYIRNAGKHGHYTLTRDGKSIRGSFDEWRRETGVDARSSYSKVHPNGVKVFVRPNKYEKGRANVAVVNWDRRPEVELNLSDVLNEGQTFRIVSAQDFYGPPILTATYDGQSVRLPMKAVPAARPVGLESDATPVTEPQFGVFVVLAD